VLISFGYAGGPVKIVLVEEFDKLSSFPLGTPGFALHKAAVCVQRILLISFGYAGGPAQILKYIVLNPFGYAGGPRNFFGLLFIPFFRSHCLHFVVFFIPSFQSRCLELLRVHKSPCPIL
jgi:hypothetical protein